jgi:flavin reductase (DIM6/NTAB) family NADH-FMN oxidoreductase RutF
MPKTELPIRAALYPVPVALVTCIDKKSDKTNIIAIAWCGVICSEPPLIGISIRPSRYSHRLISQTGDFAINVPSKRILKQADHCGSVSGSETDKFRDCSFTAVPSHSISSPMIKECPVNIECRLKEVIKLGSHDMFIGQVVAVHADKEVLGTDGNIDYARALPFVYNQGEYWSLGEKIGYHGFSRPR